MELNEKVVDAYRTIMNDPARFNFTFKPMKEAFVPADKITANHILYEQYIAYTQAKDLPKVIFYILMLELYGACPGIDENGYAGYPLKINP